MPVAQQQQQVAVDDLEAGFRSLGVACATSYGYAFSPASLGNLAQVIRNGVQELRRGGQPSAATIEKAQTELVRLVAAIVADSVSRGEGELHETNLTNIWSILCPCPPWIREPC